jgi:hypothetical protein
VAAQSKEVHGTDHSEENKCFSLMLRGNKLPVAKAGGFDQYPRAEAEISKCLTSGKVKLLDPPKDNQSTLRSNRDFSAFPAVTNQDGGLALKVTSVGDVMPAHCLERFLETSRGNGHSGL